MVGASLVWCIGTFGCLLLHNLFFFFIIYFYFYFYISVSLFACNVVE